MNRSLCHIWKGFRVGDLSEIVGVIRMPTNSRARPAAGAAAAERPPGAGAGRANIVADVHEPRPPRIKLTDDEILATMAYKILAQFKTCKDIRISVKGEYWERLPELRGRRLEGTCLGWSKKQSPDMSIRVLWEDGTDTEHLDQLFHPDVDLTFLPYANGNPAPRLTGRAAARLQREEAKTLSSVAARPDRLTLARATNTMSAARASDILSI